MLVEVINSDLSTLNPVYAPEHEESVVAFYSDLVANNKVMSVKIKFDDGRVLHMVEAQRDDGSYHVPGLFPDRIAVN